MDDTASLHAFRQAVADDLAILARLHHQELDDDGIAELRRLGFPATLGLLLESYEGQGAQLALEQALEVFPEPLPDDWRDELAADYAAIYLTYAYRASPCESVWLDQENLGMQAPMFEVRAFYRLFHRVAADWRQRPDDHLVLELQFLSALFREDHPQALAEAARFLDTHLMRWLPRFAQRVSARCNTAFYAAAARLTAAYCDELRDLLVHILGQARPSPEAVEAAMTPRPEAAPINFMPGLAPTW